MNIPGPAATVRVAVPSAELALNELQILLLASGALILTGFFAVLRSALLHSVPSRVLERARSDAEREALRPLLSRAESLATSASIFEITSQICFVVLVLALTVAGDTITIGSLGLSLLVAVPLLVFASEVFPSALRGDRSDALLCSVLGVFDLAQKPLAALLYGLERARRATMRVFRTPETAPSARQIVEDIRDVIEDSDREEGLGESEREIIENVVDFYDVDVAEVMTPRTELFAIEVEAGVDEAMRIIADSGHSRIPVYEGNLDTIIGVAYAQEILQLVSRDELETSELRSLLRPVSFVPETKLVSELLAEFRRDKQKMAVVLDEYGGTSGVVTMGDILVELVGDIPEELGKNQPEPIRKLDSGLVEVQGGTHVSDVNEELDLELPEEADFETLAGFVLSELGRFPKKGESFVWSDVAFTVADANDRRVLVVHVRLPEPQQL